MERRSILHRHRRRKLPYPTGCKQSGRWARFGFPPSPTFCCRPRRMYRDGRDLHSPKVQKKRQEVTDFEVSAVIERADQHPKVFTKILITYSITGKNISKQAVERAVELSEKRYCGAQAMLQKAADITHEIVIHEPE